MQEQKFKEMFKWAYGNPQPEIKPNDPIFVRLKSGSQEWKLRYFSNFVRNGKSVECYRFQRKGKPGDETFLWDEYSITNPLNNDL